MSKENIKEPESVEECMYFTKQTMGKGKVRAWVWRKKCPECNKGFMKKPKKTAKEYVCTNCGFSLPLNDVEKDAIIHILYKCPFCEYEGYTTAPYKRKTLYGKKAYVFICEKCGEKIGLYKKLNAPKKWLEKIGVE